MRTIKKLILILIRDLEYGNGVELKKILENVQKNEGIDIQKLKQILNELEEEGLIEERHFQDGRIDYQLEPKGWEFLNEKINPQKR
ncbi:hypothetical protein KY308_03810 [Candidatus Woesearchaeota archaeon]|nr:hypothetical protein [Candidatus Woesearchaeota archaeon]